MMNGDTILQANSSILILGEVSYQIKSRDTLKHSGVSFCGSSLSL